MEQVDFQTIRLDGKVATVALLDSGNGYTTDWWVSSYVEGYLRVIGHLSVPIYGQSIPLAANRVNVIAPELIKFVDSVWGGSSVPTTRPENSQHIPAHLAAWTGRLPDDLSDFQKTVAYYELLSGFKVSNPAVLIAKHMGVSSVRTVHDRIARARKDGLLDNFGQGRAHA